MIASPIWKNRDYMLLWGGQVISTLGSTALSVVYPLLILAITDSVAPRRASPWVGARFPCLIFSLPREGSDLTGRTEAGEMASAGCASRSPR